MGQDAASRGDPTAHGVADRPLPVDPASLKVGLLASHLELDPGQLQALIAYLEGLR